MLNSEIKRHAALYGIFFGIMVFVFAVLITMTLVSRNSWRTGLAAEMQQVLDSYEENTYTVNKYIDIDTPLATSAALYSLIKKGAPNANKFYGIIVRIPTIIGPIPAVFIYTENAAITFAGYATDAAKATDLVNIKLASGNMNYWESMIPKIIENSKAR